MSSTQEGLGPLHDLLARGLPTYVGAHGLDVKGKLAPEIGISYQAIYKWFGRNRISAKRMPSLIFLSEQTPPQLRPKFMLVEKNGKVHKMPWRPLTVDDFLPFIS